MSMTPRRFILIGAGLFLLIVGGIVFEFRRAADRARTRIQERTLALIAEAHARPASRPVLRGKAEPGNAWTDYDAALDLLGPNRAGTKDALMFYNRHPDANPAWVEGWITTHAQAIERLRKGTQREEATFPYEWERGAGLKTPRLLRIGDLSMLAICHARLLREAGRCRESAEILLDIMQVGGDLRRNSLLICDMVGISIVGIALDEFPALLDAGALPSPALEDLDRGLEALDRSWSDIAVSIRNGGTVNQVSLLAGERVLPMDDPTLLEMWRFGFSRRIMEANAAGVLDQTTEMTIRHESLPWLERVTAGEALMSDLSDSPNLFVRCNKATFVSSSASVRQRRAQLRLLRMAVRYRRTGILDELEDPFGTRLRHSVETDKVLFWSLGRDGSDHGGRGEWKGDKAYRDIVLEIKK